MGERVTLDPAGFSPTVALPSHMVSRERQIWAFQANPNVYDVVRAVREMAVDAWTIAPSDVRLGDLAVIWKAKGGDAERGVVAFGLIVSPPFDADDASNPYWRSSPAKRSLGRRVLIRYVTPRDAPFWESGHPWLGGLNVAKGQQTVFRVSREEWERLVALTTDTDAREWLSYEFPAKGDDWLPAEYELACRVYFEMLQLEKAGAAYTKADYKQRLEEAMPHRSRGSWEYRFQNISWVLHEMGLPWIRGYRHKKNTGAKLAPFVADVLRSQAVSMEHAGVVLQETPPPAHSAAERPPRGVFIDYVEFNRIRREIGRRGEHYVAETERASLQAAGRNDLAARVEIVSETKGDGLGYDVASFEADGSPRYIEVKTTTGDAESPFYLSRHELERSAALGAAYRLYRVYDVDGQPRYFALRGPLEGVLDLEPTAYEASLKPIGARAEVSAGSTRTP